MAVQITPEKRAEFERLGLDVVQKYLDEGHFSTSDVASQARIWLSEKRGGYERPQDELLRLQREGSALQHRSYNAALCAAIFAGLSLLVGLLSLVIR